MREYSHEYANHWFYIPTPFEKASGIWPVRAGETSSKPHYKIGPRFITYYSLHFVLDGKGEFNQEGYKKAINKGDIFCLFPNKTHQYTTDPSNCLNMFWFAFDGRQSEELIRRIGLSEQSPHAAGLISNEVRKTIKKLCTRFSNLREAETLERISLIYELFYNLSTMAIQKNIVKVVNSTNWLQESRKYMDNHYSEGISVSDVAKYLGINRSYFTSSFTKEMQMSPLQYLTTIKMKKAYQMLLNPNYTVTEIALSVGYSDLYSFSRAFKNHYAISPSQFRDNPDLIESH
ncbi:AraC family transcriptional regulator [Pullulanibacillus sp. KACC 23026]|uniref:AraC family transcriptional regulator n=1 Tax=Pullulanibacillus sp. KACC 23026 TaxID=3028315 RepID=UPI0023AF18B4|nr:AraC family transcriptional regulator [Pullulanibacillus sp. KACC 23026]WEG10962.1 AraC family transcriptional regulator [Pullulanibacillus sp. KACC 23026]